MNEYTPEVEDQLTSIVLDKYDMPAGTTLWRSHDTIGPDDMAHYFVRNDKPYVLVWNDFPNATFIHDEGLPAVHVKGGDDVWLHIKDGALAGYYSLYEDSVLPTSTQ